MKYTKLSETAFQEMVLNAGVIVKNFNPTEASISNIMFATSGGINFDATPSTKDYGADIDNCPENTAELKKLEYWSVRMSGTAATVTKDVVKSFIGAADVSQDKITPRNDYENTDFEDLWWVGDYSDKNGDKNGGFCAIHMMKALSTGGFKLQTVDKDKGKFNFEYTAHYSIASQNTVPFEIYVKAGAPEA